MNINLGMRDSSLTDIESRKSFITYKNSRFRIYNVSFPHRKGRQSYRNYCKLQPLLHEFIKGNRLLDSLAKSGSKFSVPAESHLMW